MKTATARMSAAQAPPLPSFDAHPGVGAAGIFAKFWPADSTLTVTVDDPLTAPSPDYATEFVAVEWTDVGYGGWFDVQHEIKAGDVVSVTDGTTTKSHIVIDLRVTSVDVAADRVSGTVPTPDSAVHLFFDVIDGAERNITADASGQWMADFSVAGGPDEPSVDIVPGIAGGAAQFDDDGNATVVAWQVPRPEGWQHNPATGHDYLFVEDGRPWADAEAYAVSLGGHLVTVSDAAENGWLIATFGTEYYIGMNDRAIEGTWVWASGEPVTFTGWLPDEPNDYHGGQDAARIWNKPPIGWDDVSDSGWDPFVVEREANDPPLAAGDAYTVVESGSLTVPAPGVLGNDSDPEGGPLTAALGDDVTHGTLSLAADGSFTYVPAAGFAGMDAFTYAAVDALGQRATATVTITVASAPMASWSFDEGEGTTAFDATGRGHNGTVVGSTWTAGVSGSALSFDGVNDVVTAPYHPDLWPTQSVTAEAWVKLDRLPAAGTGATVLLNGDGVASAWSYYLSPIEGGHVQWSLFTGDEIGGSRPIRRSCRAAGITWPARAAGSASRLYVDGELAAEATGITAALISRSYPLTIGAYYYGSALSQMLAGAIDEVAIHARSLSASEIAEHHAEFANDPPLAAGDAYTVVESGSLTVPAPQGVLGNDSDPEGGPLTAALGDDVTHGTLSLAADGSFTYVPAAGFAGMDAFTYAAVDALGQRATATVTITVTPPPNNPPIAYAGGPYTAAEGRSFALEGRNSFDIDAASGDSLVSYAWDFDADGIFDDAVGLRRRLDLRRQRHLPGRPAGDRHARRHRHRDDHGAHHQRRPDHHLRGTGLGGGRPRHRAEAVGSLRPLVRRHRGRLRVRLRPRRRLRPGRLRPHRLRDLPDHRERRPHRGGPHPRQGRRHHHLLGHRGGDAPEPSADRLRRRPLRGLRGRVRHARRQGFERPRPGERRLDRLLRMGPRRRRHLR